MKHNLERNHTNPEKKKELAHFSEWRSWIHFASCKQKDQTEVRGAIWDVLHNWIYLEKAVILFYSFTFSFQFHYSCPQLGFPRVGEAQAYV